jgi:hypothetical protein
VEPLWVAGNLAFHAPELGPRLLREGERPEAAAVLVLEEDGAKVLGAEGEGLAIPRGTREARVVVMGPEG